MNPTYNQFTFQAMGTPCEVQFQPVSAAQDEEFKAGVAGWVEKFEQRFSRFVPESLISRANAAAGIEAVAVGPEDEELLSLCDWFHWATQGVFDPALLPVIQLWDYHQPRNKTPDEGTVGDALRLCGWKKVQREKGRLFLPEKGMGLDVGGIGKEYAVDRVFELAARRGIRNILVNFGRDLRVHGEPPEGGPWRIGLEDPADQGRCWGGVAVHDRAVTTSGNYLRHFTVEGRQFGHILDPRSGYPVDNGCKSVSVIAPTCTEAGILSTTAFILGGEAGLAFLDNYHQAEGCVTTTTHRYYTRRFHEYLITQ
jgi:thiamine biosynthesis lipoprotein